MGHCIFLPMTASLSRQCIALERMWVNRFWLEAGHGLHLTIPANAGASGKHVSLPYHRLAAAAPKVTGCRINKPANSKFPVEHGETLENRCPARMPDARFTLLC